MFERIDRVLLPVPDVEAAAAWYMEEFEFRMVRKAEKEIDLQLCMGEAKLTLMQPEDNQGFQPLLHLDQEGHVPCFNFYTHWEDLHREWLDSRLIVTTLPMETPDMSVCEMKDRYGNIVGICHEKVSSIYFTPHEGPVPPMFHRVLAVFIPVVNLEASIRWYTETLGFTLHHHWGQGADLKIGDGETVVTMIVMEEELHKLALAGLSDRPYYSLQTANIQEAYRSLTQRGVATDGYKEQDGVCRFTVRTPEGLNIRISEKELVPVG